MAGASGKKLDETYKLAWIRGLKTTYYLRTLGATSAEKSTGKGGELNAVSSSGGAYDSTRASARSGSESLSGAGAMSSGSSAINAAAANLPEPEIEAAPAPCGRATPASRSARPASKG